MKRSLIFALVASVAPAISSCAGSQEPKSAASVSSADAAARADTLDRLDDAATLVTEFREKLPPTVAKGARCIAIVPAMVKGGLILGARHGEGFVTCRGAAGWSAPAPISVSGGGAGLQVGVQSVDLLMLVMSEEGMKKLLHAKFALGADVSVSAGPVGRGREADTDTALKAEVLSYSRSRGLFAGAEVSGAVIEQDAEATRALYGTQLEFRALLNGEVPVPARAKQLMDAIRETFS
jgi:lipid-binding SYLF domain-containing protein